MRENTIKKSEWRENEGKKMRIRMRKTMKENKEDNEKKHNNMK